MDKISYVYLDTDREYKCDNDFDIILVKCYIIKQQHNTACFMLDIIKNNNLLHYMLISDNKNDRFIFTVKKGDTYEVNTCANEGIEQISMDNIHVSITKIDPLILFDYMK